MIQLKEVIQAYCIRMFGRCNKDLLESFVKALVEAGCIAEPPVVTSEARPSVKEHADTAYAIWEEIDKPDYIRYAREGITALSTAEIETILNLSFSSSKAALDWLRSITQLRLLRSSFFSEGFSARPDTNIERWEKESNPVNKLYQTQLYGIYQALGFTNRIDFPLEYYMDDGKDRNLLIHGKVHQLLELRMKFIKPYAHGKINVYYLSNARGIFNKDEHLAEILALKWFDDIELVPRIQAVLDKPEHKLGWLGDIASIKNDILKAVERSEWPKKRGAWHHNPEPYEAAVNNENIDKIEKGHPLRQSLQDWPVIEDLLAYYQDQLKVDQLHIIPVLTVVKGRVATTKDTVDEFLKRYGDKLNPSEALYSVSENASCDILFQDVITKKVLQGKCKVITVGEGTITFDPKQARDVLAKLIYELYPDVERSMTAKAEVSLAMGFAGAGREATTAAPSCN